MTFLYRLPYVSLILLSALICAGMALRAYRSRRSVARALAFSWMAIFCAVWMILVALDNLIFNLAWRQILWWLIPLAILSTTISLFFFALEFSLRLRRIPRAVAVPTLLVALLIGALSITNPLHHQMWTVSQVDGFDIQVMGRLYLVQVVYIYLLTLATLTLLVRAFLLSTGILRRQTLLLLLGTLIPVAVSVAADVLGWDPLPFVDEPAFSILFTVLLFGWTTLRFNTFYLLPVASDVIIKNMQPGVLVTDVEGLVIYTNPAAQKILAKKEAQLHGQSVVGVLAEWLPEALSAWNEEKEEIQLILGEAPPQYYRFTISKLAGNASETIGSLLTLYDNTEQMNYEKLLNDLASFDSLTGCYNRRFFYEMVQVFFNQVQRSAQPLSILMLDLDHFKQVNDTYGHVKGDLVLQQVAAVCKSMLRPQDVFSRYGGEEFILAMPETTLHEALIVAERLRAAIEAVKNELEGVPITASIGVVETRGEPALSLDSLLNRADEAMYASKHAGRNRVTAWQAPEAP